METAVRRQIYFDESDSRMLSERSRATGLSVSELVRRAIQECYGRRVLPWEEVFAHRVQVGSAPEEEFVTDALFDSDDVADVVDAHGQRDSGN